MAVLSRPAISNTLCLFVSPETIDTAERETPRARAMNSTAARLAFPSTGGAFNRNTSSPSRKPLNSVFLAFGITRTFSLAEGATLFVQERVNRRFDSPEGFAGAWSRLQFSGAVD